MRTLYCVSFILIVLVIISVLFHLEYYYERGIIDMIKVHYVIITTGKRIKFSGKLIEKEHTLKEGVWYKEEIEVEKYIGSWKLYGIRRSLDWRPPVEMFYNPSYYRSIYAYWSTQGARLQLILRSRIHMLKPSMNVKLISSSIVPEYMFEGITYAKVLKSYGDRYLVEISFKPPLFPGDRWPTSGSYHIFLHFDYDVISIVNLQVTARTDIPNYPRHATEYLFCTAFLIPYGNLKRVIGMRCFPENHIVLQVLLEKEGHTNITESGRYDLIPFTLTALQDLSEDLLPLKVGDVLVKSKQYVCKLPKPDEINPWQVHSLNWYIEVEAAGFVSFLYKIHPHCSAITVFYDPTFNRTKLALSIYGSLKDDWYVELVPNRTARIIKSSASIGYAIQGTLSMLKKREYGKDILRIDLTPINTLIEEYIKKMKYISEVLLYLNYSDVLLYRIEISSPLNIHVISGDLINIGTTILIYPESPPKAVPQYIDIIPLNCSKS